MATGTSKPRTRIAIIDALMRAFHIEKVQGLKSRYPQSLSDLQNVYDALNQKAFKSELDLSRVKTSKEK